MRILVLANVPPGAIGGAEVQALNLARQWNATGHHVLVAGTENIASRSESLEILRIPILRFTKAGRGISYLLSVLILMWRLRYEYDLVYCRFLKEQAIAASFAKKVLRLHKPIIANPAGASSPGDVAYLSRLPFSRLWINLLGTNLDGINAMSPRIEKEIVEIGLGTAIHSRIPNGVILPPPDETDDESDDSLRTIFIGRLTEEKGIDSLIDAAHELDRKGHSISYCIVGDGPLRASLESRCLSLGLSDRFRFLGTVSPESVPEHLRWAHLFVLPSRSEGMPGALIEAISHGLPVVATRVSGSEDIVEQSFGWLVPPDDPVALAGAINEAIHIGQSGLKVMGKNARTKAEQEYDIADVANNYIQLFTEISGRQNHGLR